ncbi:AAA family ATPase [Streptomyces sp. NPDC002506]|uniref:AAA family ATPase n=1 Tax=Streptomyces sp. NPDC002506 TaxID=3154536 RepID=UPI003317E4CA
MLTFLDLAPLQQDLLESISPDDNHLVSGEPGTGKSVLAVHRAALLDLMGHPTVLLARSNLLRQQLATDAAAVGSPVPVLTFHRWLINWYQRATGKAPARTEDGLFDWVELMSAALSVGAGHLEHLVVDEGQDLPQQFYQLCRVLGIRMTVFADEHQRITDTQSTLVEIEQAMGRTTHHEITGNQRNSRPVAALAGHFHLGSDPLPLPDRDGPVPELLQHTGNGRRFAGWLSAYATANPGRSIGVILGHTRAQQELFTEISRLPNGLQVQMYIGDAPEGRYRTLNPGKAGISIINRASVKGLGFDTVIVPDTHIDNGDPTAAELRMRYYVMATRTRQELYLCYAGGREPSILEDVPAGMLRRSIM